MLKRFTLASLAVVLLSVLILLVDGVIAELTGLSFPGEISAAFAFFVAFFVGGRIGGDGYFWLGVLLFVAIKVFSLSVVVGALRDIQPSDGGASAVTWLSVATESWVSTSLSLVACIVGLILGAHGAATSNRRIADEA
jgi:hypothetical protein